MNGVSKITVTEDVALITFHRLPCDFKVVADILRAFAGEKLNIDMISQSAPIDGAISLSFTVDGNQMIEVLELINKMRETTPSLRPLVSSSNNKVQLYGEEMRDMYGVAANAVACIADAGAEIALITTSEIDISLLITNAHLPAALDALRLAYNINEL